MAKLFKIEIIHTAPLKRFRVLAAEVKELRSYKVEGELGGEWALCAERDIGAMKKGIAWANRIIENDGSAEEER